MEIGIEQLSMTARGEYRIGARFTLGLGGGSAVGKSSGRCASTSSELAIDAW